MTIDIFDVSYFTGRPPVEKFVCTVETKDQAREIVRHRVARGQQSIARIRGVPGQAGIINLGED